MKRGIFLLFFLNLTYPTKVITVWLENQWNCAKLCAYREFFQKVNHMMAVQLQEKKMDFFSYFLNFFREITIWIYGIFIGWWGASGHTLVSGNSAGNIVIGRRGWHLTSSWKKKISNFFSFLISFYYLLTRTFCSRRSMFRRFNSLSTKRNG